MIVYCVKYCVKYCVPCTKDQMTCLCCKFNYTYASRNGLHLGMVLYLKFAMQTSHVILNVKCIDTWESQCITIPRCTPFRDETIPSCRSFRDETTCLKL
jgi:hypothetical protein